MNTPSATTETAHGKGGAAPKPDASRPAAIAVPGGVHLLGLADGTERLLDLDAGVVGSALSFSPSGARLAVLSVAGELHLWSTEDWQRSSTASECRPPGTARSLAFLDEERVAVVGPYNEVSVLDVESGQRVQGCAGADGEVACVAVQTLRRAVSVDEAQQIGIELFVSHTHPDGLHQRPYSVER